MSERDVGSRTLSALKWGYGGAVARALAQLLVQMLLARLLGPEVFGQATAALLVMAVGWIMAEAGFGTALIQKVQITDLDIGRALGWVLLLSTGTAALVMATATPLAAVLGGPELVPLLCFAGALIPIQALANIPASLMRRNLDARRTQFIYIGSYLFGYAAVGLPLAWAGAGAWSLMAAAAVQAMVSLLASYAVIKHTLRPRLRGAQSLWRFGSQVTVINVTGWMAEHADRFLVNQFWGAAALGEYTAAAALSRAPANLMMSSAQSVTLASASRVQDDPDRLGKSYLALLCLVALFTGPFFALLAWNSEAVVYLVYGDKWGNAGPLFAAFCASIPALSILSVTGPVLWAIKAVRQDLFIQLIMLAAVVLGFYSLRHHSLAWVAWLIPAIYAFRCIGAYASLQSRLSFSHLRALRAVLAGTSCTLVVSVVCFAMQSMMKPTSALFASMFFSTLLSLWMLRKWPYQLLSADLVNLLCNRARESRALAKLCKYIGLTSPHT